MSPLESQMEAAEMREIALYEEVELGLRRKEMVRKMFYSYVSEDEEVEEREAIYRKELDLAIQRTKLLREAFLAKSPTEKRFIMHQVIAHKIMNKVYSPCRAEERNRIPFRGLVREEKEGDQKENLLKRFLNFFHWDKTYGSQKTEEVNVLQQDLEKVTRQKVTEEKEKKKIEEKKPEKEKEMKMEKKKRINIFNKKKEMTLEEQVADNRMKREKKRKKNRKARVKAERLRREQQMEMLQYIDDPEERRRIMQRAYISEGHEQSFLSMS
ncbi:unnamed protein product [Staurois parvus]|uniref:Uncharacterized protein n=1 Tax=Staurois parvus TaxID=386267 RepID=A0ABN9H2A2_9NEOB|nr:unnamed protein product [Staurois parvus]